VRALGLFTLIASVLVGAVFAQKTEPRVRPSTCVRSARAAMALRSTRLRSQRPFDRPMPPARDGCLPPGTYLSGTVELLSNVTLELQAGAVLQASPNVRDYGSISEYGFGRNYGVDSSGEGFRVGLIVARKAHNIAITGRGTIDGNGDSFFDLKSLTPARFRRHLHKASADSMLPTYGLESVPSRPVPPGGPGP